MCHIVSLCGNPTHLCPAPSHYASLWYGGGGHRGEGKGVWEFHGRAQTQPPLPSGHVPFLGLVSHPGVLPLEIIYQNIPYQASSAQGGVKKIFPPQVIKE